MAAYNLTVSVGAADQAIADAAGSASLLVTIVSLPQATLMLRVLNQLDLYIFIDIVYPTNFDAILKIMTDTISSIFPNMYSSLADDDGAMLPPRFQYFGYQVHFLKNLGGMLTVVTFLIVLSLLTLPFYRMDSRRKRVARNIEKLQEQEARNKTIKDISGCDERQKLERS